MKRFWQVLRPIIQWAGLIVILVFAGVYLSNQWEQIRQVELTIHWGGLLLSQVLLTLGLGLLPLAGYVILNALDAHLPLMTVLHVFYVSNLAKYLPGSIWALPSRALLYNRNGLTRTRSAVVVFWEVLLMVVSAALVSLLAYRLLQSYLAPEWFVLAAAALAVVVLVLALPAGRRWLGRRFARFDAGLSAGVIARATGVFVVAWVVMGVAFAGMIASISPRFAWGWSGELVGLFTGSWLVGFVAIFAPGGIGVRDFLLVLGLSVFLNDPLPAVSAVIARLMWTLAEVLGLGLVQLWRLGSARKANAREMAS